MIYHSNSAEFKQKKIITLFFAETISCLHVSLCQKCPLTALFFGAFLICSTWESSLELPSWTELYLQKSIQNQKFWTQVHLKTVKQVILFSLNSVNFPKCKDFVQAWVLMCFLEWVWPSSISTFQFINKYLHTVLLKTYTFWDLFKKRWNFVVHYVCLLIY